MAVNNALKNVGYGVNNPLQNLAPLPIIARRDPTSKDIAELGTNWINPASNTVWVITSVVAGVATWSTSPASGTGIFTDVTITGAPATDVLTVDAGNVVVTAGDVTLSGLLTTGTLDSGNTLITGTFDVNGTSTFTGNVDVTGDVTITGDFDITDTGSISLTSTNDAAGAIALTVNGGTSETLVIHSVQGTSASAINIDADAGGIDVDAAGLIAISSSRNNAQALLLEASAGGIDISATGTAGEDIDITASGSSVNITATEDAALAVYVRANGGTSETIRVHSDQGTGVGSINLLSDVGGITLTATGLASADAINLEAPAGGIDVDAALQINIASSQNAANAIVVNASAGGIDITAAGAATEDIDIVNTAGSVNLSAGEAIADSVTVVSLAGGIDITAAGGAALDIDVVNTAGSVNITAGESAADSIVITSLIGGIDIVAAGASAGEDIDISAVGSSVNVSSTEDAALAIYLHANGGTSETVDIHSDQGTGVASINVHSDVGGITFASGLASADAINITASDAAGGIDVDSGTAGFIVDTTGAISLDAAAASNFTATGAFDVTVSSTAGSVVVSGGEAVADAVQLTAGNAAGGVTVATGTGGLTVNSTNGVIALNSGTAAINVGTDAVAHTVTIGNVSGATAVAINSGTGHITLTSTGTGDIIINSDDTLLLDADGVLELNSSAGAISIGNDADAQGINVGTAGVRTILMGNASAGTTFKLNSPANVGISLQNDLRIITGAGSPNGVVTAPAGSLWLRTDPAGATSRLYINTDSGTTWTNVTCAA